MRQLATIQRIVNIAPIENADAIERADVLGWHVVVKKSDGLKPGDLVVYCEIDSLMPQRPEFEFLKASNYIVRTVRLRGQVSQGIVFPLSILDGMRFENDTRDNPRYEWREGFDVSGLLGITKYEKEIPHSMQGTFKGAFPTFIRKTDETRIQSYPEVLQRHKGVSCYATEKVDGASITVYMRDGEFGVCSRNLELVRGADKYWAAVEQSGLEAKIRTAGYDNFAMQGELLGEGVQGNKYQIKGLTIRWFNWWEINDARYMSGAAFAGHLSILHETPVTYLQDVMLGDHTVDQLVELSRGTSLLNKSVQREGIVVRPYVERADIDLGRLSFKVINPDFLLKFKE